MIALIKKCKQLDRKAQREMVDHLTLYLYPICLRYSKTYEDAQDLMQESLIQIFNALDSFKSDDILSFKAWCKRITINKSLSKFRKNSLIIDSINTEEHECIGELPDVFSQLNVQDLLQLLNQLPEKQKCIFNLAVIDDYDHKTIAKLLHIQPSHSRTILTRARKRLQTLVIEQNNHYKIKNSI